MFRFSTVFLSLCEGKFLFTIPVAVAKIMFFSIYCINEVLKNEAFVSKANQLFQKLTLKHIKKAVVMTFVSFLAVASLGSTTVGW